MDNPKSQCPACGATLRDVQVKRMVGNLQYQQWCRDGYCSSQCFDRHKTQETTSTDTTVTAGTATRETPPAEIAVAISVGRESTPVGRADTRLTRPITQSGLLLKVGTALGFLTGWIVWQKVGNIGGFIFSCAIVVPLSSAIFTALLTAMTRRTVRLRDVAKIAALLSRSQTTEESISCRRCDYSGVMLIKRRRSPAVTVLVAILVIVFGAIIIHLLVTVGSRGLLGFIYVVPFMAYVLMTRGKQYVCPKCDFKVRIAR